MAITVPDLEAAKRIAKTSSKVQPLAVSVYQVNAAQFVVSYAYEAAPLRGLLIGQYKNGLAAAPVIAD